MGNGTQNRDHAMARPRTWRRRVIHAVAALALLSVVLGVTVAAASAPTVTIENASEVSFASARASGEVDPADHETSYHFEYATQAQFEASEWAEAGQAGFGSLPEGAGPTPVTEVIGGLAPGTVYHLRIVASNSEGEEAQAVAASTFETEAVNPPAAEGLAVSAVTVSSAHFSGSVSSGGTGPGEEIATYRFECSPECPGLAGDQPIEPKDGADHTVEADATGLEPNTTYQVRLIATNGSGSVADEGEFTTGAVAPEATTLSITGPISDATARVVGQVDPRNSQTSYWFEYGPADCASNPCQSFPLGQDADAGSSGAAVTLGQTLTGLQPGSTYHYRIVAANGSGMTFGSDRTFTTASASIPAGACPNSAARDQQHSQYLPDCRAYEMVSMADKNGNHLGQVSPISTDGNRVIYNVVGGVPGSTSGARAMLLAQRTPAGWSSHGLLPPASEQPGAFYILGAVKPDLSGAIAASFSGGLGASTTTPDVSLVSLDEDAQQSLIFHFPVFFGGGGPEVAVSDDFTHVLTATRQSFDPSHQNSRAQVYDFGSGTPTLVSAMPGTGLAPACGVPTGGSRKGFVDSTQDTAQHWVSTDGRYAFFQSRLDDGEECGPFALFRRDLENKTTALISSPALPGDPESSVIAFDQAAADGSTVFYRTATSLDPADDVDAANEDPDVYEWTAAGGNVCITCLVPSAGVGEDTQYGTVVSEDGSHLYFNSTASLTPEAPAEPAPGSAPYLYAIHGGTIRFIAQTGQIAASPGRGGQVTPDGKVLIFSSAEPMLNQLSGASNQGLRQYYRYDYEADSVTCLSCSGAGLASVDVPEPLVEVASPTVPTERAVSDDGTTVAFSTGTPLVSRDVNGTVDLYAWHRGEVSLITDGRTSVTPRLASVSADGRDILFADASRLTSDAVDGASKLYDARIDGGFLAPPDPGPVCQAEACLAPPSPPAAALAAGSDAYLGAADSKPKRHGRNRKKHGKRRHQKRSHHNRKAAR